MDEKRGTDLHRLAKLIKQSDEPAFKALFDEMQQSLFNFILFLTKDTTVSEDLLQEVFLKLWNKRKELDPEKSIRSYLYTIANNLALNHIRDHTLKISKHQSIDTESIERSSPQAIFENTELSKAIAQAISSLSEKNRVTFMMSRYEGYSYKEIAERLDVSVKTIETRMTQALKELRIQLANYKTKGD